MLIYYSLDRARLDQILLFQIKYGNGTYYLLWAELRKSCKNLYFSDFMLFLNKYM